MNLKKKYKNFECHDRSIMNENSFGQLELIDLPPLTIYPINNISIDLCPGCNQNNEDGTIKVENQIWHAECFICSSCRKSIKDGEFIKHKNFILHKECYSNCFLKRCSNCSKFVESDICIQIENHFFHPNCFYCSECQESESIKQKCIIIYNKPYCLKCSNKFLDQCKLCLKFILPKSEKIEFFLQNKSFFLHKECLQCPYCLKQLNELDINLFENKISCKKCFNESLKQICVECNYPIFGNSIKFNGIFWHIEHFICSICKEKMKPNMASFEFGILKCRKCLTEELKNCKKCNLLLEDSYYEVCGFKYHKNCVICTKCNISLINKNYGNINGEPFCSNCCEKMKLNNEINQICRLIK